MTRSINIDGRVLILEVTHNGFQWTAVDDSTYEPGCPIGLGDTEQDAVNDLIEQMEAA